MPSDAMPRDRKGAQLLERLRDRAAAESRPLAVMVRRCRGAAVAVAKLDRIARDAELVLRLSREAVANGMGGFLYQSELQVTVFVEH